MKKALIIGGAGFVGNYLMDYLNKECGWSVAVTKMANEVIQKSNIAIYNLNILEKDAIVEVLNFVKPDYIFHLAAQSSVKLSWKNPELTIDINIKGAINLLESVKEWGGKPKILMVGSGEEYGYISPEAVPIREETFVVSDFCKQVAEIEKGKRDAVIKVGNLSAYRDFTDVRDVVVAYALLMEKGKKGETYNVGSGKAVQIQFILQKLLQLSSAEIKIEIDKEKLRPVDVPIIEADIKKLVETTGWKRKYELIDTLKETLNYWRQTV